ncbi:MAG: TadE/TadG family type IV pilus assembly protein [Gemmataceae bacterium]
MVRPGTKRSGAVAVEFAAVAPVAFVLVLGIMVGGMAVFRFHELSTLAREGARYASVHGTDYAKATGNTAATADDIKNFILAKAVGLDTSNLTCTVTWNASNSPYTTSYGGSAPISTANTVTVTLSYQWIAEAYFTNSSTMTATSTMVMSF